MKLNLKTALSGPLLELEQTLLNKSNLIESWFRNKWQKHKPPFYSSCDLRNSGFKITPVDTNLFPGGFNNISQQFLPMCIQAITIAVERCCPTAQKILLIPENHTRNQFYLQNIWQLKNIFVLAGFEIRLGTLNPEITETTKIELNDGKNLILEPIFYDEQTQTIKIQNDPDFEPCCVILNNDLSAGVPEILQQSFAKINKNKQKILPPIQAGWTTRRKSKHFQAYDLVVQDFANFIGIDGWRINPAFGSCKSVNFHERQGEECLTHNVAVVLERIKQKYKEYGVSEKPYVVVKADAGTYGMGIMTISDASEIVGLNRKQRNKMSVVKEGLEVSEVIIQEGVHTIETINDFAAEPVVYMIDKFIAGAFYRINDKKGKDENLNAPGMFFETFAFANNINNDDKEIPNRFYSYGVIARLAALAAAVELEN